MKGRYTKMYIRQEQIYYADDNTPFFSKAKCLEYEKKIRKYSIEDLNIELWNENFEKLIPKNDMNFSDIYFFRCKTVEDFDKFDQIAPLNIQYPYPSKKTDLFFCYDGLDSFITTNEYEENINYYYLMAKEFLVGEK